MRRQYCGVRFSCPYGLDLKEIDDKFAAQERKTQKRFNEYDGCYLGYYAQWIYFTFFFIGIMASAMVIVVFIAYHYGLL